MKLKLDENLGHQSAELFRLAGHNVAMARGEGLSGASDADIIAACQHEERCLVTLDLDFGNPLVFKPWEYCGIAVLHLPSKPSPIDLKSACLTLVRALKQSSISGKLWSVQRGRVREYQPDQPGEENA